MPSADGERTVAALVATAVPPKRRRRLRDSGASPAAPASRRHNLPYQLSSFIGREHELSELRRLLGGTRLLTLTGTGGIGKTRLALQVAADLVPEYEHGVWLIDLVALAEPTLIVHRVAAVLGVREKPDQSLIETLTNALQHKRMLLVFDNCEHVIQGAAKVAHALLQGCESVQVMATSREPLGLAGEQIWQVLTLSTPPLAEPTAAPVVEYEAVRLFLERAKSALPRLTLNTGSMSAVTDICRRLDGLPLAIELAAARVSVLTMHQIAERLDDRFRLLKSTARTGVARHQTLEAALAWSLDLLTADERSVFVRFSVFSGSCTLAAAEAMCAADGIAKHDVLDLLAQLIDKSLLLTDAAPGRETRYRMLQTVHAFAAEQLLQTNEFARVRDRHAAYFTELAEDIEHDSWGPNFTSWEGRLEEDVDNLRAALRWRTEHLDVDGAQRLGAALGRFWHVGNHLSEGRSWLNLLLTLPEEPTIARAAVLLNAGLCASYQGDYAEAALRLREALRLSEDLGDRPGIANALTRLAELAAWQGEATEARDLAHRGVQESEAAECPMLAGLCWYVLARVACDEAQLKEACRLSEQALSVFRSGGYARGIGIAMRVLGRATYHLRQLDRAVATLEESSAQFRKGGWGFGEAWNLATLGWVAVDQRDLARAERHFRDGMTLSRSLGLRAQLIELLDGLAYFATHQGRWEQALRVAGAANALHEAAKTRLPLPERRRIEQVLVTARSALGERRSTRAWAAGRLLDIEQALAEGIGDVPRSTAESEARAAPMRVESARANSPLTPREHEVAGLVAIGLSNRQIAERLVIAERTAETHIERIFSKLDIHSRSQLTRWIVQAESTEASTS
jgi:non-specific serine/threonine protein kinase